MAKEADLPEENHLRAWREFRHMTQDELAAAVETNASVISLLESGARKLSPKWLRRLAPVLNTSPGYLLDHDPNDLPTAILDVWADIPDEQREQALKVLQSFRRTGTDA
ncbi:helix-turn-helix transcriptional regulator [Brevundimonas diminuta]|uniref:helix-turn-helix domain-containing protein n=1 Tax=Brevundimonas diminuta TaxID=293 RepID=UPI0030F93DF0